MPVNARSSDASSRQSPWMISVLGRIAPSRAGCLTRHRTACPSSSNRRRSRPPMYPLAPVRRTVALIGEFRLLVPSNHDGINHTKDGLGRDFGLDDARGPDHDAAVVLISENTLHLGLLLRFGQRHPAATPCIP